jgi:diguanylate cyclase (GGDEF)-like protein
MPYWRFGSSDQAHDVGTLSSKPSNSLAGVGAGQTLSGRAPTALVGALILILGIATSIFAAAEWRSNALDANKKSFESTASDLSSTLQAKLTMDVELTRTMRARATMETQDSETQFLQWFQELQRGTEPPSEVAATFIQVVPASGLSAFRRETEADPAFRKLFGAKFTVVPPGHRSVYCLSRAVVGSDAATRLYPELLDYCAPFVPGVGRSPYPALVHTATDTGSFIVTRVPVPGTSSLVAIGAAVYKRGASIATPAARRAAVTGFIGTTFDSAETIRSVLTGRRSLTLALYHRNVGGSLELIGRAGAHVTGPSPGYSVRRNLGESWILETTGTSSASASANSRGLVALALGLLVTILVFLLHRVLSGSRQRAWSLVGERTGELEYLALHDSLTDLPNRTLVLDRAEQILARSRQQDTPVTALFVDIDGFKQLNDRYGHKAGDEILRHVGARLNAVLRDSDTVGRLGGDEFVMLVDSFGLDVAPELVAERILDVLRQPIELTQASGSPVSLTASIGIATGRPASAEDLMQDADLALYKAKAIGKNGYVKFESAMQTAAQDRMHLETQLAGALDADQFFLVYQPIVDLQSGQIVGVEALLRWSHPASGVIAPDLFIPIAEDNGLIVPIGRWVLEQACAQGVAWRRSGYPLNISVNVSARQLERVEFVEEVRDTLTGSGLDPATLTLEITETALMRSPDVTAGLLIELKALGVRIAVDDFGTGYSSLAYLRQFPVDSLKIDRTFITGLALSSEAHALTHTLIQLGSALGLETLAEGVEQHSQVRELQREGCDLAQGFLFARPLNPDALEHLVQEHPNAPRSSAHNYREPVTAAPERPPT